MRETTLYVKSPGKILSGRGETPRSKFSADDEGFKETFKSRNDCSETDRGVALYLIPEIGERK
ncbi:MAG: hypothetical protein CVV33_10410 [Methanomicrobiales archaeon HGW-Methanomicrobiales-4]|nr:MAG: hypothetical protein CVV33_10410 [Methanomicrobiales archaeon HGW-Methanomicrobiales-4]